jgi:two-component system response regulator FlrC
VPINCAAIPETMLEALLFGFEKGAFTGAQVAHAGKFEQAQGGTLLLDEISEMPQSLQSKLLRVLQEREVERLGSTRTIALDVRVVAATNRTLRTLVSEGRFREDLYYRLSVFPLEIPPLRDRTGDIWPLFEHSLRRHCAGARALPAVTDAARVALCAHRWPGNVRELDNLAQRALVLLQGDVIGPEQLHFETGGNATLAAAPAAAAESRLGDALRSRESRLILQALAKGRGSRKSAAELLGISPRTLRHKLSQMRAAGIAIPED